MKTVHFSARWLNRISDTVVEEYPAGSTAVVSDDRAAKAAAAGVLKGEPVDADLAQGADGYDPRTDATTKTKTKA